MAVWEGMNRHTAPGMDRKGGRGLIARGRLGKPLMGGGSQDKGWGTLQCLPLA